MEGAAFVANRNKWPAMAIVFGLYAYIEVAKAAKAANTTEASLLLTARK